MFCNLNLVAHRFNQTLNSPKHVQGSIQNFRDWYRHLYSSCGSKKHR